MAVGLHTEINVTGAISAGLSWSLDWPLRGEAVQAFLLMVKDGRAEERDRLAYG